MRNKILSALFFIAGVAGLVVFLVSISGCRSSKELLTEKKEITDSVRTEVKWKDTVIYLKGDSVKITTKVPCPDAKWKGSAKGGRLNLDASLENGELHIDCKTDSLLQVIKMRETEIERIRKEVNTKQHIKQTTIYKIPNWCKWYLALSAAYFIIKFRKGFVSLGKSALTSTVNHFK
jgi:hypothetical protein